MCWWSVLQMEQVTSTRLFWGKTMPYVPMMEKTGCPTQALLLPHGTAGAPELPPPAVLRGTCVPQPSSGPGYCHLLPFIPGGSYQMYLETLAAFSLIAAELLMGLTVFQ